MTTPGALAGKIHQQFIKGERHLFSSSDDSAVMKQILATHVPDGREVAVRPLLHVVEDVLRLATPTVVITQAPQQLALEAVDADRFHQESLVAMLEALAYSIHRISCEITYKCSSGGDAHATTLAVFNLLSNYSWDAKVVLALAAFALSFGEFWLIAQLQTVNPLAKSLALLKQMPDFVEHSSTLKPRFEALNNLIRAMVDVAKCVVDLTELPSEYISPDSPDMTLAMAHVPTAVYWTIRSIVACTSQVIGFIGLGHEYMTSTMEAWELSSLAHKVSSIYGHLMKQLSLCRQQIEGKKHIEAYHTLIRLFETTHIDNLKILRALMRSPDNLPIVDGSTKKRVSLDVLRRKIVVLFITDLDITQEELLILVQLYTETHNPQQPSSRPERQYEIIWLPVVDRHRPGWSPEAIDEAFDRHSALMPWYYVHHPSVLDPAAVKYFRDVWHFDKKPLLVVLDPQGKVVCPNALHMMWIWGGLAFPFTSSHEAALWREETWRLEFLVDEIDPMILQWIRENRYVCLYGGGDLDWIRRFTKALRAVAQELRIPLEMIYVGRSSPKERVRKAIQVIADEKLSGYWQDPTMVWFFWARLESMWHSKMQHGRSIEEDVIMREVMTLLSFDGSEEGWAVISRGPLEFVRAHGRKLLDCLGQFEAWKPNAEAAGFLPALVEALQPYQTHEHCTRLILPGDTATGGFERVVCAECKKPMEKYVLYRCCNS